MFFRSFVQMTAPDAYSSNTVLSVGIVSVDGLILSSKEILGRLNDFDKRRDIDVILLRINSSGGAVAPSQEIFDAIRGIAKRVVVSIGATATGSGYYVASAGDLVFAVRGSVVGGIGRVTRLTVGNIKSHLFSSNSKVKAVDSDRSDPVGEELSSQFVADVATARKIAVEDMEPLSGGKLFSGSTAKRNKLVDGVGGLDDALKSVLDKWGDGKKSFRLVYPEKKRGLNDIIEILHKGGESVIKKQSLNAGYYYLPTEVSSL